MSSVEAAAKVGGIFALLTLLHFIADWVFQSHTEAMAKPTDAWVRARHCCIYTLIMFVPIWWAFDPNDGLLLFIAATLWFSHFVEDTYLPVFMWAKYIRKPLEMELLDPMEGFKLFAGTALGKILLVTLDQVVHLLFLVPIAIVICYPTTPWVAIGATFTALGVLWGLAAMGKVIAK